MRRSAGRTGRTSFKSHQTPAAARRVRSWSSTTRAANRWRSLRLPRDAITDPHEAIWTGDQVIVRGDDRTCLDVQRPDRDRKQALRSIRPRTRGHTSRTTRSRQVSGSDDLSSVWAGSALWSFNGDAEETAPHAVCPATRVCTTRPRARGHDCRRAPGPCEGAAGSGPATRSWCSASGRRLQRAAGQRRGHRLGRSGQDGRAAPDSRRLPARAPEESRTRPVPRRQRLLGPDHRWRSAAAEPVEVGRGGDIVPLGRPRLDLGRRHVGRLDWQLLQRRARPSWGPGQPTVLQSAMGGPLRSIPPRTSRSASAEPGRHSERPTACISRREPRGRCSMMNCGRSTRTGMCPLAMSNAHTAPNK